MALAIRLFSVEIRAATLLGSLAMCKHLKTAFFSCDVRGGCTEWTRRGRAAPGRRRGRRYHAAVGLSDGGLLQRAAEQRHARPAARQGDRLSARRVRAAACRMRSWSACRRTFRRRPARLAEKKHGHSGRHISVAATHSHTGPLFIGPLRKLWHEASGRERWQRRGAKSVDYPGGTRRTRRSGDRAGGQKRHGRSTFGRRGRRNTALVQPPLSHEGWNSTIQSRAQKPRNCAAAGPIDPAVSVLLFTDAAEASRSLDHELCPASRHDWRHEYAADYPFYVERKLQARSWGAICLDLCHRHVRRHQPHRCQPRRNPLKGHAEAERIGTDAWRNGRRERCPSWSSKSSLRWPCAKR